MLLAEDALLQCFVSHPLSCDGVLHQGHISLGNGSEGVGGLCKSPDPSPSTRKQVENEVLSVESND